MSNRHQATPKPEAPEATNIVENQTGTTAPAGALTPPQFTHSLGHNILGAAGTYLVQGLGYATIMTALPSFAEKWDLSEMMVSLILLATCLLAAAGSLVSNAVAVRASSRRAVFVGLCLQAAGLLAVASAHNLAVFLCFVFVYGLGLGMVDASQNMQGVTVEARAGRPLLGRFYAVFTAATICGALLVSASHALHDSPFMALLTVVVLDLVVASVVVRTLEPGRQLISDDPAAHPASVTSASESTQPASSPIRFKLIAAVGFVVLGAYLLDSAVSSWSTMYVQDGLRATASLAPMAYAAYQGFVLVARLLTDPLELRFGRVRLAQYALLIGVVGAIIVAAVPTLWGAILGFSLTGLTTGALIPLAFSAAGSLWPERSDEIVARVNLFNYAGALVGAVLLGLVASGRGLGVAFLIPGLGMLLVFPLLRTLTRKH